MQNRCVAFFIGMTPFCLSIHIIVSYQMWNFIFGALHLKDSLNIAAIDLKAKYHCIMVSNSYVFLPAN